MISLKLYDIILRLYRPLWSANVKTNKLFSPLRFFVRFTLRPLLPVLLRHADARPTPPQRKRPLVVSFTSFPARIDRVWQVVRAMLAQTVTPDKIVLWLSREQFASKDLLPQNLLALEGPVFEIRLEAGDLRSHKKHAYAFREFQEALVVLIDDDLYYPTNTLERLLKAHRSHPTAVVCQYGYLPKHLPDGSPAPYASWLQVSGPSENPHFFFGSGGGTLFQPAKLPAETGDAALFTRLTPSADDVWLNAMVRLSGLPVVKLPFGLFMPIEIPENVKLVTSNVHAGQNDEQIRAVNDHFASTRGQRPFASASYAAPL